MIAWCWRRVVRAWRRRFPLKVGSVSSNWFAEQLRGRRDA